MNIEQVLNRTEQWIDNSSEQIDTLTDTKSIVEGRLLLYRVIYLIQKLDLKSSDKLMIKRKLAIVSQLKEIHNAIQHP